MMTRKLRMNRRTFLMAAAAPLGAAEAVADLKSGGRAVMSFHYGERWDKPFLYPIRTVSGKLLSRRYPVEKAEGESNDHIWHRGIWYGHGVINGHDFWREQGREKTSILVTSAAPSPVKVKGGSGLVSSQEMRTPRNERLGTITQRFELRDSGALRMVDATITIAADAGQPLTFGDTDDGGFAFRLNEAFRQDKGAKLRNSSGLEGTEKIWGKPAHWVDYSAQVDGTPAGVAVFDHPSNLRHPTQWHARGYSLCAANPFASKSFSKGKGPDGAHTLPAGSKLVLRYRVVIHEGPFEPAAIEEAYRKWART